MTVAVAKGNRSSIESGRSPQRLIPAQGSDARQFAHCVCSNPDQQSIFGFLAAVRCRLAERHVGAIGPEVCKFPFALGRNRSPPVDPSSMARSSLVATFCSLDTANTSSAYRRHLLWPRRKDPENGRGDQKIDRPETPLRNTKLLAGINNCLTLLRYAQAFGFR